MKKFVKIAAIVVAVILAVAPCQGEQQGKNSLFTFKQTIQNSF